MPAPDAPGHPTLDYDLWAKSLPRDDLWGQVRRTVRGNAVPSADIEAIVERIVEALCLEPRDVLIDFACGNGALASYLFERCNGYLGSDISPYMIGVAQERFANATMGVAFMVRGAATHAWTEPAPDRFTKALCYGSFAYFSDDEAQSLLEGIQRRFPAVARLFVGNLPDLERATNFYGNQLPSAAELSDPSSRIGVWRSRADVARLAARAGWSVSFSTMPEGFFASHYRYDVLLTREDPPQRPHTSKKQEREDLNGKGWIGGSP
jgi:SAM-dependent methyltransferase